MTVVKVTVTRFGKSVLEVGPVRLTTLKPIEVSTEHVEGDVIEVLAKISESEALREEVAYVVVEIAGAGAKLIYGDTKERGRERALLPRPARLLKVGVVRLGSLKYDPRLGAVVFEEKDVEWHAVEGDVYVFDSRVEVEGDVAFVVLETDLGRAVVKTVDLSKSELFSQLQEKRVEESSLGETESGERSSLSS